MSKKVDALADIDSVLARTYAGHATSKEAAENAALDACIERYTYEGSAYRKQAEPHRKMASHPNTSHYAAAGLRGILSTIRADVDAGVMESFESRITSAVFADMLGQADILASDGYLLPAAVLGGATLEEHLRQLCVKHRIPVIAANGKPIPASVLNAELKKASIYHGADQAQVEAWQKVRNEAAHGLTSFAARTLAEINLMLSGIRAFIAKFPP